MISEEALKQFKSLWREEFGQELSSQEAAEKAASLLSVFDVIYRPITKQELINHQNEGQELE